jgi:hypothetical protein
MISIGTMLVTLAPLVGPAQDVQHEGPSDAELTAAWERLSEGQRREAVAWFQAELDRTKTFQRQLMDHVFFSLDKPRRRWPDAEPAPVFDAAKHCPAQPIVRQLQDEDGPRHRRESKAMFADVPARRLDPAWRYDWGRGTVVKVADPDDPDRIFRNALAGAPPELDLAEAILVSLLDDGSRREVHHAFSHVYSHRDGVAFPGITLYDAWASGRELEMPDVECLGIVHLLEDDWTTFVAPVSGRKQQPLYAKIADWFGPVRRQRGLVTALARAYLQAEPVMRDGYEVSIARFHGVWERHLSDPPRLLADLPAVEDETVWRRWFGEQDEHLKRDAELAGRAASRQATLRADGARVRAVLVAVLKEMGALDPPKADPDPPSGPEGGGSDGR